MEATGMFWHFIMSPSTPKQQKAHPLYLLKLKKKSHPPKFLTGESRSLLKM